MRSAAAIFALMVADYVCVYVFTPNDLAWQLGTSLSRVMVQVWPIFLVIIFLSFRNASGIRSSETPKIK